MKKHILFILFLSSFQFVHTQSNKLELTLEHIVIEGNKRTDENVIRRELTLSEGDTIDLLKISDTFNENRNLLNNTRLFNFVTIRLDNVKQHTTDIVIEVEERWYIWPEVYLMQADRNLSNWLHNTDFSRIKYGIGFSHYNFRGRKEKLSIRFISGFMRQYALTYNNIYLDRNRKHSLGISLYYDAPDKYVYNIVNNEERVYKSDNKAMNKYEALLNYSFRNKLYLQHTLNFRFRKYILGDSLYELNPQYLNNNSKTLDYPDISYVLTYDKRNSKHYPTAGHALSGTLQYAGFGNKNNRFMRFEMMGEKAHVLIPSKLFIDGIAKIVYNSSGTRPLFTYDELGYTNNLRGFEYYVANGKSAFINRNTLKYQPFRTRVMELSYIPVPSINKVPMTFYLNLFFDCAYVKNNNDVYLINNDLPNRYLYAFGGGIDLVTYYDRTFSLFYARNSLGTGKIYFSIINSL